ncbi:divalent metal cation (Fe/Co/Zn/Cd) transporter [Microlunatus panaciterrae]|uniref:Divalent metal cation (Fe/Co/Zn/Cd) transporter n=1 Tax=Microlunatus panaciterrae TaxID=400768 RepID=A0ABS2REN1_9ACTN|nr:divalent metal cation (Fe/Co/Zn/Cd) transporter [Microlunatus panaciterrae]
MSNTTVQGDPRRATLVRRIRFLVLFTITYNVIEAVVALLAGRSASSSALLGFGLDSVIEVSSALAVAWQFSRDDHEARERTTLRVISFAFFALAAFVAFEALRSILTGEPAEHSTVGIALAAVSLMVMPTVSYLQRRTGKELGSSSAVADSKQTLLCTYMSGALLVGLLLNSAVGWWWADPFAGLAIAGLAVREGIEAWKGESCCSAEALFERGDDEAGAESQPCGPDCNC